MRARTHSRLSLVFVATLVVSTVLGPPAQRDAGAQECPEIVDEGSFASERTIRAWNKVMADAGRRPTASPAHERFVDWIERTLRTIPGVKLRSLPDRIDRWLEKGATLSVTAKGRKRGVPK